MKNAETLAVLKMVQAALPGAFIDEHTPDVWANACASVDPDIGLEAARRLVVSLSARDRFPAPADFLGFVRAVKREREPCALPADTGQPLERDVALEQVQRAREVLRDRGRKVG